ncbi:putative cation diffusion facilitator 1 protein [Eutypa lata UCREL1]|uniref:Putative cation diffusion facilitator 1 protein n=1 Tax=Eutypa lata (strain UCR-EL1) TaxID=1287681 RepID=M7SH50_EUTLA|nr:putative cation diffusion facilitator 1 protein [Eutypa lata UCREL1]
MTDSEAPKQAQQTGSGVDANTANTANVANAAANTPATTGSSEPVGQDQQDAVASSTTSSDKAPRREAPSPLMVDPKSSVPPLDLTSPDPLGFGRHRHQNVTRQQMSIEHPKGNTRKMKKFYSRQNDLIDQFLGADDEERLKVEEDVRMGPKIKFAVNASFVVNFCLFVIQLYAAISTGSLSMDLVSSFVMLTTSRMAARPSIYKYPVVESGRTLGSGPTQSSELHIIPIIIVAIATYRRYPAVHVFFIDHRNDIVVNTFGLVMSVVGDRFVWYLDPIGAIIIALIILFSWVANAFEQVWLLVGKSAPNEFISKLIYISMTHDLQIQKVDTYHAGQHYYVEVDVVMDENVPLKVAHDVSQSLQRKLEGLGDVERAFVHVDYEHAHDVKQEHKPLYENIEKGRSLKDVLLFRKKQGQAQLEQTNEAT